MRPFRLVGWLLVLFALGLLAWEAYGWATDGTWKVRAAGQLWFDLHKDSLLLVQPAIERYLWTGLWDAVETLLTWPAWAVIGGLGLILIAIATARGRKRNGSRKRYFRS